MGFALAVLLALQAAVPGATQAGFAARVAEFDARARQIDAATGPEARARATLDWLRALEAVLRAVPFARTSAAERAWLDAHGDLVVYNEPGGTWIVRDDVIWRAHDRHRNTAAAEEIAWLAINNGVPGECEGYVPCYAARTDMIEGEYLRREPQGRRRGEVLDRISGRFTDVVDDLLQRPRRKDYLDVPRDCADLLKGVRPLRAAVAAVNDVRSARTLALLDRLIAECPAKARGLRQGHAE